MLGRWSESSSSSISISGCLVVPFSGTRSIADIWFLELYGLVVWIPESTTVSSVSEIKLNKILPFAPDFLQLHVGCFALRYPISITVSAVLKMGR